MPWVAELSRGWRHPRACGSPKKTTHARAASFGDWRPGAEAPAAGPDVPRRKVSTFTGARESALASAPHTRTDARLPAQATVQGRHPHRGRQRHPLPVPHHPRAGLSNAQWRALSPGEKIERLLNIPLDRAAEILAWPLAELDPLRLSLRMQVWRIVFMIGMKAMREGKLGRERAPLRAPIPPSRSSCSGSAAGCCGTAPRPRHRPQVRGGPGHGGRGVEFERVAAWNIDDEGVTIFITLHVHQ
jgi:hypothetical protein